MQHSLVNPLGEVLLGVDQGQRRLHRLQRRRPAGGITNVNLPEAEIKRRMLAAVRRRVVVADGAKLGVRSSWPGSAPSHDVDVLSPTTRADADGSTRIRGAGVEVPVRRGP